MRSKENRKFLLLCLLMLLLCTSCASSSQNADGSPLEFFNAVCWKIQNGR